MATKITRDILESYLLCKFKGNLKLTGQQGIKSDYETLRTEMRAGVRLAAIDKILARHPEEEIPRNIPLTISALKEGASFVLDATLEDDLFSLAFDGLKKVEGPSKLGSFHYIPLLFSDGEKVRKEQRLVLEICGLLLSRFQGQMPSHGIIWHGKECKATKVRLNADLRRIERLLRYLKEMCCAGSPSKMILNDHCQVCEFRQRCHEQAVKEDNLSLLRGMGEKEVKRYARKGIFTVTQLAHTFRPRRKGKRVVQKKERHFHALQALAIREKKIYVFGTPELPESPVKIYLDMEGIPEEGFVYLIGMIVVENGSTKRYSFWADDKDQEKEMFARFLAEVSRHEIFRMFCYGGYERAFLKRMRKVAKNKKQVDTVLNALVNILSLVYFYIYFPTYSNSLKHIGGCLGISWTESKASGIQSIVWRKSWEAIPDEARKQKLIVYNLDDCAALKLVTDLAYTICTRANSTSASAEGNMDGPPVAWVKDIDRLTNDRKWGKVSFFHPDYEYINSCAYFDYQRERIYARSSKTLRKNKGKKRKQHNRTLRVTRHLQIGASRCPRCMSTELTKGTNPSQSPRSTVKRAFDLVLTSGGIKRRIIECRSQVHQCQACGHRFIPENYQRLDMHFHGLKSWAMYQHIAHGISFGILEEMLKEFFNLRIPNPDILMFKTLRWTPFFGQKKAIP